MSTDCWEIAHDGLIELHAKPIGLLNVDGYYDHLIALVDHMVSEEFLKVPYRQMLLVDDDIERLLDRLARYRPPACIWVEESPLENAAR